MQNEAKKELEKMLLLMERMDNHYTLSEALEKEERIEHKRDTYTDIDQFLQDVDLGSSFVGLGYIQGYESKKIYPTNPKTIKGQTQADAIKAGMGKLDKSSRAYSKLNGLVNDTEFTNPTGRAFGGFRSMSTPHFAGVIKMTSYVFNWGGSEKYADYMKNYIDKHDDMIDNVFSKASWNTNPIYKNIKSIQANPSTPKDGYHQRLDAKNSIYGFSDPNNNPIYSTKADGTQYQKRVFKMALKNIEKQWSKFCLVDGNGEIDAVDEIMGPAMGKIPGDFNDLRPYIDFSTMKIDEINFINDFSQMEERHAMAKKQWLLDHIMYIVAYDRAQKRYVRYINPDVEIDAVNVNRQELSNMVKGELKDTEYAVKYVAKPAAD